MYIDYHKRASKIIEKYRQLILTASVAILLKNFNIYNTSLKILDKLIRLQIASYA